MKKFLQLLLLFIPAVAGAQMNSEFYPQMCDELQAVFCDYVSSEAETKYISSSHGQFVGQLVDNKIYGWGYFLSNDGAQTFGQYRNGKHFFGITQTASVARVGSEEHFVEYDLETGGVLRIHTKEGDRKPSKDYYEKMSSGKPYNGFYKIKYSNGDVYYGETYGGRRHGYGVYYWTNGDYWYGEYRDGYRQGYGALFKTDRKIFYGKWIGDRKVE